MDGFVAPDAEEEFPHNASSTAIPDVRSPISNNSQPFGEADQLWAASELDVDELPDTLLISSYTLSLAPPTMVEEHADDLVPQLASPEATRPIPGNPHDDAYPSAYQHVSPDSSIEIEITVEDLSDDEATVAGIDGGNYGIALGKASTTDASGHSGSAVVPDHDLNEAYRRTPTIDTLDLHPSAGIDVAIASGEGNNAASVSDADDVDLGDAFGAILQCPASVTWSRAGGKFVHISPNGVVARCVCDPVPDDEERTMPHHSVNQTKHRDGSVVGPFAVLPQQHMASSPLLWRLPFCVGHLGISRGSFAFQVKLTFEPRSCTPSGELLVPLAFVGLTSKHFDGTIADTSSGSRNRTFVPPIQGQTTNNLADDLRVFNSRQRASKRSELEEHRVMMLRTSDGAVVTSLDPNAVGTPYLPHNLLVADGGATPITVTTLVSLNPGNSHVRFVVNGVDCGIAFFLLLNPDPEPLFPTVIFGSEGDAAELQTPEEEEDSEPRPSDPECPPQGKIASDANHHHGTSYASPTKIPDASSNLPADYNTPAHSRPTMEEASSFGDFSHASAMSSSRLRIRSSHAKRNRLSAAGSRKDSTMPREAEEEEQLFQMSPIRNKLPPLIASPSPPFGLQKRSTHGDGSPMSLNDGPDTVTRKRASDPSTTSNIRRWVAERNAVTFGEDGALDLHHRRGSQLMTPSRSQLPTRSGSEDPYGVFEAFRRNESSVSIPRHRPQQARAVLPSMRPEPETSLSGNVSRQSASPQPQPPSTGRSRQSPTRNDGTHSNPPHAAAKYGKPLSLQELVDHDGEFYRL